MYERFSEQARAAMRLANSEARRLNHEYLATEHILLGMVKLGAGRSTEVLKRAGVWPDKIQAEVERFLVPGAVLVKKRRWLLWRPQRSRLLQTPRAKKVIESAMEDARAWGHGYVGTEHLLLGLLRREDDFSASVLATFGLNYSGVRLEVERLLAEGERKAP